MLIFQWEALNPISLANFSEEFIKMFGHFFGVISGFPLHSNFLHFILGFRANRDLFEQLPNLFRVFSVFCNVGVIVKFFALP